MLNGLCVGFAKCYNSLCSRYPPVWLPLLLRRTEFGSLLRHRPIKAGKRKVGLTRKIGAQEMPCQPLAIEEIVLDKHIKLEDLL